MQTPPSFNAPPTQPFQGPPSGRVRLTAISDAWDLMKQDFMPCVIAMPVIISAIGACACGIGILVTGPILYVTVAVISNDFFRPAQSGQEYSGWYPRQKLET